MNHGTTKFNYWYGYELLVIDQRQVSADWGRNPDAVAFANLAFRTYYRARRATEKVSDTGLKKKLVDKLEDAAKTGWSTIHWGDLETVFDKMARTGTSRNQWTDSKTDVYRHASTTLPVKQTIWKKNTLTAPYASVQFLEEMDKNMQTFGKLLQGHLANSEALTEAAKDPRRNWKLLGETMSHIKSIADKASPFLWLAPESVQRGATKTISYINTISTVQGLADDFLKYHGVGYSIPETVQMTVLKKGLSYLPILGDYYAGALDMIPGMKIWFKRVMKEHQRKIDSIPGLWQRQPVSL